MSDRVIGLYEERLRARVSPELSYHHPPHSL